MRNPFKRKEKPAPGPFRPGQVITAAHMNLIVRRIEALERSALSR